MSPWWLMPLLFVGSTLLSLLLKRPNSRAANLDELDFPTATEDRKIPIIWGTVQIKAPNVVWYGDLRTAEARQRTFLRPDPVVNFYYSVGIHFIMCEGPVDQLRKIWAGDRLIYDTVLSAEKTDGFIWEPVLFGGKGQGELGGISGEFAFYPGSGTQLADAYLLTQQGGATKTPAYRHRCGFVWKGPSNGKVVVRFGVTGDLHPEVIPDYVDVNGNDRSIYTETYHHGYLGTSPNIKPWAFELRRIPNGLGLTGGKEEITGGANPANVLYEIMTNTDWGMGLPPAGIDTANFITAGETFYTEANGFSFTLNDKESIGDMIQRVEAQVDAYTFFNRSVGLWQINLIRGGYSIPGLPLLDKTNILRVEEWRTSLWEDTKNQVNVRYPVYDATAGNWKKTFAHAMDIGNFNIQGAYEAEEATYEGCRNNKLANILAHRDLRTLSRPLRGGTLVGDRSLYAFNPGDVARFTWDFEPKQAVTDLPLRINKVYLGEVDKNEIRLDVTEDVFIYELGAFADPPDTEWTPPIVIPVAIPTDEDIIMEAPRAFIVRSSPEAFDRLYLGARDQGDGATTVRCFTRHAAGTPTGSYAPEVELHTWSVIGQLNAELAQDTANPTTTTTQDIRVLAGDDTVEDILNGFTTLSATIGDLGQGLANLIMVDDEIMAVTSVIDNTTSLDLVNVYRGFLDTVPTTHAATTKVFLLQGDLGEIVYPRNHNVDVQLRPHSAQGEVSESAANTVQISLLDRARAPLPTTDLSVNGTRYSTATESLDDTTSGSGLDQVGLNIDVTYRDFQVYDQLLALSIGLPSGDSWDTNIQVRVTDDPGGSPTVLFSTTFVDATLANLPILLSRTEILANMPSAGIPSTLRVETIMEHTIPDPEGGADITLNDVYHDTLDVGVGSSALSGLTHTGIRNDTEVGSFAAGATDTYVFTIGTDLLTSGKLEAQINGGGYVDVITSGGGTSGTLAGVSSTDTVDWRHTQTGPGNTYTHLRIQQQTGSVDEAYGILLV